MCLSVNGSIEKTQSHSWTHCAHSSTNVARQIAPHVASMNSAGLMPTEARGNYLPEAPYLRETKCQRPI